MLIQIKLANQMQGKTNLLSNITFNQTFTPFSDKSNITKTEYQYLQIKLITTDFNERKNVHYIFLCSQYFDNF